MEGTPMSTKQRLAVVTGGSLGIGLAIARRLRDDGYKVMLVARGAGRLKEVAASLVEGVDSEVGDVSRREDVERIAMPW